MLLGLLGLSACAVPAPPSDPRNRSLEDRCLVLQNQQGTSPTKPGLTRAEVQAEAVAAQRRGELDKACGA
jgi:hypothetical protein